MWIIPAILPNPILNLQPRYPPEFILVVSHQNELPRQRVRGDPQVVVAYGFADGL